MPFVKADRPYALRKPLVRPVPGQIWCDGEGELCVVVRVDHSYITVRWETYEDQLIMEDLCDLYFVGEFFLDYPSEAEKLAEARLARMAPKRPYMDKFEETLDLISRGAVLVVQE